MAYQHIFRPLQFRNLTIKNRILRSNVSGRFDNYDGSGNQARINWEVKFARGGVGAIISSFVPVHVRGRIVPNYAMIDDDRHIPFWREVGEAVHAHDCKFILQLSHGGRQRDLAGVEYPLGLSSTDSDDPLARLQVRAHVARPDSRDRRALRRRGAPGARGRSRRRRTARRQRLPDHAVPLVRHQRSRGRVRRRAREPRPVRRRDRARHPPARRRRLPPPDEDQRHRAQRRGRVLRHGPSGNTIDDSLQVCQWLVEAGVDAIHVSVGSFFPHPRNPAGGPPRRGSGGDLRRAGIHERAGVPQLPDLPPVAGARASPVERMRRRRPIRSKARTSPKPAR